MAAVFITANDHSLAVRLRLVPRWLAVFGSLAAAALAPYSRSHPLALFSLFPAWVFVFSVHILVVNMRARAALPTTRCGRRRG